MSHDEDVVGEIAWCAGCRLDCMIEVAHLPGDPAPVAVCVECGGGVELWWQLPSAVAFRPARAS